MWSAALAQPVEMSEPMIQQLFNYLADGKMYFDENE
jgi:hypothetical protein